MSTSIPRIWRNISSAGNLQRKRGNASCASMPPNAAGAATASNENEISVPIPMAALGSFAMNGQGSRFVEDPEGLVVGEGPASSSRITSITIVENPTPRPATREPPSRPPSPYIVRAPTPMGTSREVDPAGWTMQDQEQLDLARGCWSWGKAFREVRRDYEREFEAMFGGLERLSFFGFRYMRFLNTIEAVERSLDNLAYLVQAVDLDVYDVVSDLVDFFDGWVIEAEGRFATMTLDRTPVDLDSPEERAGRKDLMVQMGPELARLTEELSAHAQKPLRRLCSVLKAET